MPRRRSRNRYVEILDQELALRPLVAEGYACARCRMPLLVMPARDGAGRPVHPDCDVLPGIPEVTNHLLMHTAKELGLTITELRAAIDQVALREVVDLYRRDWATAREIARGDLSGAPQATVSYVQLVSNLVQSEARSGQSALANEQIDTPGRSRRTGEAMPPGRELERVCYQLVRQLERVEGMGPASLSTYCSVETAATIARALGDAAYFGEVPSSSEGGAFTMRISSEAVAHVVERLRALSRH